MAFWKEEKDAQEGFGLLMQGKQHIGGLRWMEVCTKPSV